MVTALRREPMLAQSPVLLTSIFTCADVKEQKALNGLLGRNPGVLIRFTTIRLLPLSAQTLKIRFRCLRDLLNYPTPEIRPLGSRKRAGRAPSQREDEWSGRTSPGHALWALLTSRVAYLYLNLCPVQVPDSLDYRSKHL